MKRLHIIHFYVSVCMYNFQTSTSIKNILSNCPTKEESSDASFTIPYFAFHKGLKLTKSTSSSPPLKLSL